MFRADVRKMILGGVLKGARSRSSLRTDGIRTSASRAREGHVIPLSIGLVQLALGPMRFPQGLGFPSCLVTPSAP